MTSPTTCVCYTTDPGYLFPTLLSAIQARAHTEPAKTDIIILGFGTDPATVDLFQRITAEHGIIFLPFGPDAIDGAKAMLARLFLARLLPPHYQQLLYLDGDTQITGPLDPLLDTAVPDGQFLAANDPFTFTLADDTAFSRDLTRHLATLGLSRHATANYFNSGVLRIARAGWDAIGAESWRLFRARDGQSRFPDQDVLNIAGAEHRRAMSLAWNFPIFMLNCRVAGAIAPRILHFMSDPKPWHGTFAPWTRAAHTPYTELLTRHPELRAFHRPMPTRTQLRYQLQQRYKQALETATWGFTPKRARILSYEQSLT